MPIDLDTEEMMPLSWARLLFPGRHPGKRVDLATMHRWCDPGRLHHGERVKLESIRIGGVRQTSREACRRFLERLADGPPQFTLPSGPSSASKQAGDELNRVLAPRRKGKA